MEALAMVGSVAVFDDRRYVFLCRISHVSFPSVLRIIQSQFSHVFVPVGLCQDGGCRYRSEFCIAFHYALLFITVERLELVAVYKQEFRFYIQSAHSSLHSGD